MSDDIHEVFPDDENEAMVEDSPAPADFTSEAKAPEVEPKQEVQEEESKAAPEEEKAEVAKDEKTVPLAALHESRQLLKETREALEKSNQQLGQFQSLREELEQLRGNRNQEDTEAQRRAEEEAFEVDPIGTLRKQNEELQAKMAQQESAKSEEQKAAEAAQAQQLEFQNMMTSVKTQVAEFEAEHPDYSEAFKFMMDKRIEEFKAIGITDPIEIRDNFDREAIALSANALQRGVNPGEAVYKLAQSRGYTKGEALAEVEDPIAKESLEQSMDRLEAGAKASSSLSGGTGGKVEGTLTLADIDAMPDAEFDKLWDSLGSGSIYSNG